MIQINKNPAPRDLNVFGLLLPLFFALIGAIAWWRSGHTRVAQVLWIVGAALAAFYWLIPPLRRYIYLGFTYAALPIGFVISYLILAITYYLVITPIGLLMRLVGRDPMHRAFDRAAPSYWIPRTQSADPASYFRQF